MVVNVEIVFSRTCGSCTACCTHLPIPANVVSAPPKAAGESCPHLCKAGCVIYQDRPAICARFQCAWLANLDWPEEWRPEQSGLLCLRELMDDGSPAALVSEIRPGALLEPIAQEILLHLLENTRRVVVVAPDGSRHLMIGSYEPQAAPKREMAPLRLVA